MPHIVFAILIAALMVGGVVQAILGRYIGIGRVYGRRMPNATGSRFMGLATAVMGAVMIYFLLR